MLPKYSSINPRNESSFEANWGAVDFHSHILPDIDDGSGSVEESLELLRMLRAQGVTRVVATPHFYSDEMKLDEFLKKRERSAGFLRTSVLEAMERGESFPQVFVGAEVAFFKGISRSERIKDLCIAGTKLLLLEMPFEPWSRDVTAELLSVRTYLNVAPVIAHIERCKAFGDNVLIDLIVDNDVFIQMNGEAFFNFFTRRRALRLLKDEKVYLLGSDCHNITSRAPDWNRTFELIEKKSNWFSKDEFNAMGHRLLEGAIPLV